MRRKPKILLALAVILFVVGWSVADALSRSDHPAGHGAASTAVEALHSVALDSTLHYMIRLPSGYGKSDRRYPVIYFLHGLPAGPTSYQSLRWVGQALDRASGSAILVIPQGARRLADDPEYLDQGPGRNWGTAIAVELPALIDSHYRTIASRTGRALVGISAGGYGATHLGLQHPAAFSVVESWSGYFEPTDPTGNAVLDLGSTIANNEAAVRRLVATLAAQFRRYPTFLSFYVGRQDSTFLHDNTEFNDELNQAHVAHTFALYEGAHSQELWKRHAVAWITMAIRHLAPATG